LRQPLLHPYHLDDIGFAAGASQMQHPRPKERTAPSLFERYGSERISRWVMAFYEKVRVSPVLAPYFRGSDFPKLLDHQTKFISTLMGGPVSFDDAFIAHAHQDRGIDRRAFEHMLALFKETLEEFSVAPQDIAAIISALDAYGPLVITDKPERD
jgi:hemoglobin